MKYIFIISILLVSFGANAAHNCVGTVNTIDIAGSGNLQVNVEGIGNGNILCALNQKIGEYGPESCKAVLSILMTAKVSGKRVRLYFRNDTNTSCNKGNWKNFSTAEYRFYYLSLED